MQSLPTRVLPARVTNELVPSTRVTHPSGLKLQLPAGNLSNPSENRLLRRRRRTQALFWSVAFCCWLSGVGFPVLSFIASFRNGNSLLAVTYPWKKSSVVAILISFRNVDFLYVWPCTGKPTFVDAILTDTTNGGCIFNVLSTNFTHNKFTFVQN